MKALKNKNANLGKKLFASAMVVLFGLVMAFYLACLGDFDKAIAMVCACLVGAWFTFNTIEWFVRL